MLMVSAIRRLLSKNVLHSDIARMKAQAREDKIANMRRLAELLKYQEAAAMKELAERLENGTGEKL